MANSIPVWPTEWLTPDCNTDPSDESPSQLDIISIDIIGDSYHPAVYYNDTEENFLYLRERVEGDPSGPPGDFSQHNWVVLCEQTGDNYYDYLFSLKGKTPEGVQIWENSPQDEEIGWDPIFSDDADVLIWEGLVTTYARIVSDGEGNWFVDWAVPKSAGNFTLGENPTLYFATSADSNNYNKDHLDCYEEAYCGDGIVLDPEECEYPDTFDNTYCDQTTQECLGPKLGTRDAYGDCDSGCGCVPDSFIYQCVEGQCGAECDENPDCQNKCEGNVRYYNGICDLASTCSCSYSTEDCDDDDGCYAYDTGCEDRDYFCTLEGCDYTYSNRNTDHHDDWVYYCDGLEHRRHRMFHDYYCDGDTCTDHADWVDDQLVDDCDDGNECTYDYCDPVTGCSNPPKPNGTECGEWRDCPYDICMGYYAYFYPDDGHDYCDGSGNCLVYSCGLEDSYCTDDDPFDGINDLTCGADCDQDEDCPQTTEKCDYINRVYCTRDGYGTCDGDCECVEDDWNCGNPDDEAYCLNCAHCGDGVVNCGEECEPGQPSTKRCLPEGTTIYYCLNRTSYETPEFDSCNDICEWGDCEKIVTVDDERCYEQLPPPTCSGIDSILNPLCRRSFGSYPSFNRPSSNYQPPSYNYETPSFSYSRPSFNFPSFSSFRR